MENKWINILFLAFGLLVLATLGLISWPITFAQPYNSTSLVNTTVNITNAAPYVYFVSAPTPINLNA